jgi:PAS domain S-box-containing protein
LGTDKIAYSAEWKAQLGYQESEISDDFDEWQSRVHPEDLPGALAYLEDYLANPTDEFQTECRLRHKNGTYRSILTRARLYRDEETGTPLRMLGCHIDVTDRKKMEQSLLESREKLRALAVHLQSVREEEAARIARELHDELGSGLTGLKMDLFWIERQLAQPAEPGTQHALIERIESTMELVDTTIENVRKLCRELRPAVLDQLGLATAIEWQASEFQTRTGIECDVARCPDVPVDSARATAVFRIFQEILTNIARHAEANKVWILLEARRETLVLTVADNGRGIDEEKRGNGLGLVGMRERAYAAGGSLDIHSIPGVGTTVCVSVPLDGASLQGSKT